MAIQPANYTGRGASREIGEGMARLARCKVGLELAVLPGLCSFFLLRRETNYDARTGAGLPNREAVKS
jgi:hypothetical protein